jgi:aminoglycoside phosphotransferase (APT) family kinase protein
MTRPAYEQLPAAVRAAVDRVLGSPVAQARSQTGGWSPGVAARVVAADGRRAFVKAVSGEVNAFSSGMHRREAVVAAQLPVALGSPRLLGSYDDGDWVALVLEDVEGREPVLPEDLPAVLAAVDRLAEVPAPEGLRPAADELGDDFGGWRRLAESGTRLDEWAGEHLDQLVALEDPWPAATAGDRLVHLDLRTDNMLLRPDGTVALVDWPWAAASHPVLDVVCLLPSVLLQGAQDPDALLRSTTAGRQADPDQVTCLVAAFAGRMEEHARRPAPGDMPAVRAFQAAQAGVWHAAPSADAQKGCAGLGTLRAWCMTRSPRACDCFRESPSRTACGYPVVFDTLRSLSIGRRTSPGRCSSGSRGGSPRSKCTRLNWRVTSGGFSAAAGVQPRSLLTHVLRWSEWPVQREP